MVEQDSSGGTSDARRTAMRRLRIFGIILLVALVVGGIYWFFTRNSESTDDAAIDAAIVAVSPQIQGQVIAVHFSDNEKVTMGQLLVEIDPKDFQVSLNQARANLAVATAQSEAAAADLALARVTTSAGIDQSTGAVNESQRQIAQAQAQVEAARAEAERTAADVKRYADLVKTNDASRQRYDQAVADARSAAARLRAAQVAVAASEAQETQSRARLDDAKGGPQRIALKQAQVDIANAQVDQAEAALHQAELNLAKTRIVAPASGWVTKRAVEPGDFVQAGQALTNLITPPPWVIANFKETQLTRMKPGQPATISVDAIPGLELTGHVDSIQPGSGARFSLLPPENATGNFVKVVQRVPVKIALDNLTNDVIPKLTPGLSVTPDVDVSVTPSDKQAGSK
jgi:membrane fusion protein (multidrug efflux system)